jgi:tetratricopeptide (TPR) repeat protein
MRASRLALFALLLAFQGVRAQSSPEAPELPRGADRNDWNAYFDLGVRKLRKDTPAAQAAFAYASAVDPRRAEPLFASWIAYWAEDSRHFAKYLDGDEKVLADPEVKHVDSLRMLALRRNPFVHQGLTMLLYDLLPGRWPDDEFTRGWIAYGNGKLGIALELFGRAVDRDPAKFGYLRFERASAFVNTNQLDSAAAQLNALLAQLRAQDEKKVGSGYESKEMLEYAIGLLHRQAGRAAAAQLAFGRALVENPGFVPAHVMLGDIAAQRQDTAVSLLESAMAIEIDPADVMARLGYGRALLSANRPADAAVQFRKAVALGPLYGVAYLRLGTALEAAGDKPGSRGAYEASLKHMAHDDRLRPQAIALLEAAGGSP